MAVIRTKSTKPSPIRDITEREKELQAQINELEDFVVHGAERERLAAEERLQTLPPLPEIQDREREKKFTKQRLSRREIVNEKRAQASNGLLLLLLVLAMAAIVAWVYSVVSV